MNYRIFLTITIVTFLTYSCCSTKITQSDKEYWNGEIKKEYEFPPREIPKIEVINIHELNCQAAIFPKEYTMMRDRDIKNNYTPTLVDIKNAERILKEKNKKNNVSQVYNNYNKRQYMGYYSKEGEKILLINFLNIKNSCQKKSLNAYLFDKYFLDLLHPNEDEERRLIILP